MIIDTIKQWDGSVSIDGTQYDSAESIKDFDIKQSHRITLKPAKKSVEDFCDQILHRITVRQYMTKPASPAFDFMERFNNNNPMPLVTMVGTKERETSGMIYMKLHGDITGKVTYNCMKCGKPITNPVSQFFGMGPECGGHNYVNPFEDESQLRDAVEKYRRDYLQKIVWEGWIIKSAILNDEILSGDYHQ